MEENNNVPMIPKHQHQAEMMHMSRAVKIIAIISVSAFVAMVIMAYVFVTGIAPTSIKNDSDEFTLLGKFIEVYKRSFTLPFVTK